MTDIPDFLRIPAEERAKAWHDTPPRPTPSVSQTRATDAATEAFRAQVAAEKKIATENRIAKMKARIESKNSAGKRWDPRRCRWV